MAPSSSKFCPQVAHKRFATLEWHFLRLNFTVRVAHKKGVLRLAIKGLLRCFTGCMTRFPNHLERVLPRKYRPKDPKTRTKDQRTRGPRDQRTKGPEDQGTRGTKGPGDQGTKTKGPPGNQQTRTKGVGGILFLIRINVNSQQKKLSTPGLMLLPPSRKTCQHGFARVLCGHLKGNVQ